MTLLIRNLSQIATPLGRGALRGRAMRELAVYDNAIIVIGDGRFAFVGREADLDADLRSSIDADFDAHGATAVPGSSPDISLWYSHEKGIPGWLIGFSCLLSPGLSGRI